MAIQGPWLVRNYYLTGAPVFSSETGHALWVGNNQATFSYYSARSIDRSEEEAWSKLPQADQAELDRLANDEIATSNWYTHRAWAFIRENPQLALQGAFRKVEAGFSPLLNPVRDRLAKATYAISYIPVAILGLTGMFLNRRRTEVILIAMFFGLYVRHGTFWAHTSHRSYLDVYWIIFGAWVVESIWRRFGNRPARVLPRTASA